MGNRRMPLSGTGKEILEKLCDTLEKDRPFCIKLALAKGIANSNGKITQSYDNEKSVWNIPDNIIRDNEYLLFKHLIINALNTSLSEEEINKYMLLYIELGLRICNSEIDSLSTLEDYRIKVLS